jgi:hypothetical protein
MPIYKQGGNQFQPNPEYLADSVSSVLYNIPSVGTQRFTKSTSSLYIYTNYFIEKRGAVWVAGFVTDDGEGNLIETIIVTSLSDGTYPWQATWPAGTVVEKAPALRLTGQQATDYGTEGTSIWASRADHTHPFPPNLPNQAVNDFSSPFFQDIYAGFSLYFNAEGSEGQGGLGKTLQLPTNGIGSISSFDRENAIIRDEQDLYFGNADGENWSRIMVAGNASATGLSEGTLADARLTANVSLDNQNNSFTAGQTITATANTSALTTSYSVTGANTTALLNLSGTWNTSGIARGILLNITDTASNAASRLLDLQTGGTTQFSVDKTGGIAGVSNILAQRNSTNAQTFRVHGTFTDASNGRRLDITSTTAGIFTLTATGNGTGASGNLLKLTAPILLPVASLTLATNGDLGFEATSNTSLRIRYRGSDGTTRSATLTLV